MAFLCLLSFFTLLGASSGRDRCFLEAGLAGGRGSPGPFSSCGHGEPASLPELSIRPRIINGKEAHPGAWPWNVALLNETGYFICGGSLISSNWVITAAHCNVTTSSWCLAGMHDRRFDDIQELIIAQVFRHPMYIENTLYNDITLLKLNPRAHFNSRVSPVFLPRVNDQFLRRSWCKIIGFGSTDFNGTMYPNKLQVATVTIMSNDRCKNYWDNISLDDAICAWKRGVIPGLGDSGGSLACWKDRVWTLAGIISSGQESFPTNRPFVATRVTAFLPWIKDILAHN